MTEFDPRPPLAAVLPAAVAAAVSVLAVALGSPVDVALVGPGAVGIVYGAHTATRRYVTLGTGLAFIGVVFAAGRGLPISTALVAALAVLVAYDTGEHALTLGVDVGRHASTGQSVLVHASGSVAVGTLAATLGYGAYVFGPTSLPVTGLIALLFAAVLLMYVLGD